MPKKVTMLKVSEVFQVVAEDRGRLIVGRHVKNPVGERKNKNEKERLRTMLDF